MLSEQTSQKLIRAKAEIKSHALSFASSAHMLLATFLNSVVMLKKSTSCSYCPTWHTYVIHIITKHRILLAVLVSKTLTYTFPGFWKLENFRVFVYKIKIFMSSHFKINHKTRKEDLSFLFLSFMSSVPQSFMLVRFMNKMKGVVCKAVKTINL